RGAVENQSGWEPVFGIGLRIRLDEIRGDNVYNEGIPNQDAIHLVRAIRIEDLWRSGPCQILGEVACHHSGSGDSVEIRVPLPLAQAFVIEEPEGPVFAVV